MDLPLIISVLVGLLVMLLLVKFVLLALPIAIAGLMVVLPLALMIAGLVSCIRSSKQGNTKLLWIIIIILAPILGPLLWFFWGRKHT